MIDDEAVRPAPPEPDAAAPAGPTTEVESPSDLGAAAPESGAASDPGAAASDPGAAAPADPGLERRAFVRRMGTDAVRTAGTMFSLSRIVTRSVTAAGQAVMGELESINVGNAAEEVVDIAAVDSPSATDVTLMSAPVPAAPASIAAGAAVAGEAAASVSDPAPAPAPAAPPPILIDPEQREILDAATQAIVAVNREGHPPQLTTATVLWDGETLRFATLGWSRRTSMLRSDPRIGLLVEGPGDGTFVTVTGTASIRDGRQARDAMLPLLLRDAVDGGDAAAEDRWNELAAADADRAVIVVTPDQVLSGRR